MSVIYSGRRTSFGAFILSLTLFTPCSSGAGTEAGEPSVQREGPSAHSARNFLPSAQGEGRYLYVVGPAAGNKLGQERPIQIAFFRVPADLEESVTISVFDPDTSGAHDVTAPDSKTSTAFTIYGGSGACTHSGARLVFPDARQKGTLLGTKTFSGEYDDKWYHFGPFKASDGEVVNGWSNFKIVAWATEGNGENRFRLSASPAAAAEGFCYNAALALQLKEEAETELYLDVPENVEKIIGISSPVTAGRASMYFKTSERAIRLTQPSGGEWVRYDIDLLPKELDRRHACRLVSLSEQPAHVIFTFTGKDGYPLPLFSAARRVKLGPEQTHQTPENLASSRRPEPEKAPSQAGADSADSAAPSDSADATTTTAHASADPPADTADTADAADATDAADAPDPDADPCLTYAFDASRSFDPDNDKLSFEWDFGDGTPKVRKVKAVHVYEKPGKYTVSLTINDGSASDNSVSRTRQEIIVNVRPVPAMDAPQYLMTGKAGTLDASRSIDTPGDILSFAWDLGDGEEATGAEVQHAYTRAGTYTVKLTVTDDKKTPTSAAAIERTIRVNTPPVARAGNDLVLVRSDATRPFEVTLDGSDSYDKDGDKLTGVWEFDDGKRVEGVTVRRDYEKGGLYSAQLTVRDDSETPFDSATGKVQLLLNTAPSVAVRTPSTGALGQEVQFDASRSVDADGDELAFRWDFGDGRTSDKATAWHRYAAPGRYTVRLAVDDGRDTRLSRQTIVRTVEILGGSITADIKPVKPGVAGQLLVFEAEIGEDASARALRYRWDFGDGRTAEGKSVRYAYRKGGRYKVALSVEDAVRAGTGLATAETNVWVNTPPTASLKILNEFCCPDQVIRFDASTSEDVDDDKLTYLWDFGDGQVSNEVSPSQIYRKGGVFKVVLTVTDNSGLPGSSASASRIIRINRAPVPVITIGGI